MINPTGISLLTSITNLLPSGVSEKEESDLDSDSAGGELADASQRDPLPKGLFRLLVFRHPSNHVLIRRLMSISLNANGRVRRHFSSFIRF